MLFLQLRKQETSPGVMTIACRRTSKKCKRGRVLSCSAGTAVQAFIVLFSPAVKNEH